MENKSINLMRWLMAICVIIIHSELFKPINFTLYTLINNGVCRLAVPFFFIASGYFFYHKLANHHSTTTYFYKLIKILLIFTAIEIIIYGPFYYNGSNLLELIWRTITVGMGGIYWYLISLLSGLLLLKFFWKRKIIFPGIIIGLLLYLMASTNDAYYGLFTNTPIQTIAAIHTNLFTWPQAGLCSCLLYLSIGALIYQYQPYFRTIKIIMPISIIGLLIEVFCLSYFNIARDYNCYLMLIITTPLLFIYLLDDPFNLSDQHSYYFRQSSLYIYMLHPFFLNIIPIFIPILAFGPLKFLTGLLGCLLVCQFIINPNKR